MKFSGFFLVLAFTFSGSAFAQPANCEPPETEQEQPKVEKTGILYYHGELITGAIKESDLAPHRECGGGAADIDILCNGYADIHGEDKRCKQAKIRACRFCARETETDRAEFERALNKDFDIAVLECQKLEATPKGIAKILHDEAEFTRVKSAVVKGLETISDELKKFLEIKEVLEDRSEQALVESTDRFNKVDKISTAFNGPKGPAMTLRELGDSNTTNKYVNEIRALATRWDTIQGSIVELRSSTLNDVQIAVRQLEIEVTRVETEINGKFKYRPQKSCEYDRKKQETSDEEVPSA